MTCASRRPRSVHREPLTAAGCPASRRGSSAARGCLPDGQSIPNATFRPPHADQLAQPPKIKCNIIIAYLPATSPARFSPLARTPDLCLVSQLVIFETEHLANPCDGGDDRAWSPARGVPAHSRGPRAGSRRPSTGHNGKDKRSMANDSATATSAQDCLDHHRDGRGHVHLVVTGRGHWKRSRPTRNARTVLAGDFNE